MRLVLIAVLALLVAGCANHRTMERSEFIEVTKRTYSGIDEDMFYAAAENLFKLSDESGYRFSYPGEHAMIAQRDWTVYVVLAFSQGTHTWQLQTEQVGNGVEATVYVSSQSTDVIGAPTGVGGVSTVTTPAVQNIENTPAVYELFWARMGYLIGSGGQWPTCGDWKEKISEGETYGNIEALCLAFNTDDRTPSEHLSQSH